MTSSVKLMRNSLRLLGYVLISASLGAASAEEAGKAERSAPAPVVTRLTPALGPVEGGQEVVLVGSNFREKCEVTFGGQPAQVKKVEKQGSAIRVVTPAGKGKVDVIVRNPDGQTASLKDSYFFGGGAGAVMFRFRRGLSMLWFWINLGSWVMYPILALSLIAVALIFHGLLAIRESQLIPNRLVEDVAEYLSNGHLDNAADYCRKKSCAFGRVVLAGLQRAEQPPEIVREAMSAAGAREAEHLHQKIHYLSNIGTVAPMLGLFGTVWGLQLAFQEISGAGAQHQVLAAAIAVALNTTIAGLVVGIAAFVAYFLFRGRVVQMVSTMEILAEEMAERIIQRKGADEE